jgi:hypothetical protein
MSHPDLPEGLVGTSSGRNGIGNQGKECFFRVQERAPHDSTDQQ